MPDLFGLDLAGIINDALTDAGGLVPGVLARQAAGTRTPGSLSAGTNPTTPSAPTFQGILEAGEKRITGQLQTVSGTFLTIMGASVSDGSVPVTGDKATIEGTEYDLVELVERDPAAATFTFRVES